MLLIKVSELFVLQAGKRITFMSKALFDRNSAFSTYGKEMLALIVVRKWRP